MHVHCCLTLCLLWEPSTSAVSALWDYYSKNLVNTNFCKRKQRCETPWRLTLKHTPKRRLKSKSGWCCSALQEHILNSYCQDKALPLLEQQH